MVIEEEHVFIYRIKWAASPHKQEKKRNNKFWGNKGKT